jgi:Ricin-type beta-trefoil lectin domain
MFSRSVIAPLVSVVAIAGGCLAALSPPVANAATVATAASHVAPKTRPGSSATLPAPVSQTPVTYTPNVFAGGNCATYCKISEVFSTAVVNGEAVVAGAFGQVCTPAPGATYAACPAEVNADFIFAFDLSTGMIDPNFTPVLNKGPVDTVVAGPGDTVYMGGGFTTVNGQTASHIAQLTVDPGGSDDGQLVPGFAATATGEVDMLAYDGSNALYMAGAFAKVDGKARKVARVNATTGALDTAFNFTFSDPPPGTGVKIKTFALSPDGNTLGVAGTFLQVDGQSVPRLALINTGGGLGNTATLDDWSAPELGTTCNKQKSFINGIDFSPDSSYFVIADTGDRTDGGPAGCDSAIRFETGATGNDVQPVWQNYSGADTLESVAIAGNVVYIGGHNRWSNNECGNNRVCEPAAVLEDGLAAIDANTGIALPWWHPQTSRGHGTRWLATFGAGAFPGSDGGLIIGSDVTSVGGATHDELAMFPETTTTTPTPGGTIMSGMWSDGRPGTDEESGPSVGIAAECIDDAGNSTTPGSPVDLITCTNDNEQNWTIDPDQTIEVNGLCLDTQGEATASGTPLVVNTCDPSSDATQQWQQGAGNTVVNVGSGLCLDDPGASMTSGTALDVATCNGSAEQVWPLPVAQAPPPPPPTGPLFSAQVESNTNVPCLQDATKKVEIKECIGIATQNWTVEPNGNLVNSGLCMDTAGEAITDGTLVVLATCNSSQTQVWNWRSDDTLLNVGSGQCLYLTGTANATQMEIERCVATDPGVVEQWRLPTY